MAEENQQSENPVLDRYHALPDDLKRVLDDVASAEIIYDVGRKFGLNVEKMGMLSREVGFVVLGFNEAKDFIKNLAQNLELDEEKATEIAREINHKLFFPVRESLKKLHSQKWMEELTAQPESPPTPSPAPPTPEEEQTQKTSPSLPQYERGDPYKEQIE